MTTQAVFSPYGLKARTQSQAWGIHDALMEDEMIGFAPEPTGLLPLWRKFTQGRQSFPKLWMDAYLAAFALSGGLTLVSYDTGFKPLQRQGLRLLTPSRF
ncbi:hypothetical protein QQ054_04860 [Oscillatoria amoena NRMC-F 0135]|nr:hypothetical protein [Oscillatoria amoena NRMC-F 0135]